jgi:hypothetical protein
LKNRDHRERSAGGIRQTRGNIFGGQIGIAVQNLRLLPAVREQLDDELDR